MADIVGIGCAIHDLMLIVDKFPEEDSKGGAIESKEQSGGPCGVALIAASKLGVSAKYIGKVGDDNSGSVVQTNLAKYGVDISDLYVAKGEKTRLCIVISNRSNSSRTCIGAGGGTPNLTLQPDEVPLEALKGAKFLHVDGVNYDAALFAAKKAKEMGVKVSMDADGPGAAGREELISLVDVLVPAERCAYAMAGTDDVEEAARIIYDRYHPEILVITQGPKGGVLMHDGVLSHYPSYPVDAIDTNGAGDVFHGALDAALIKGMTPEQAVRFASATSALKCTHFGASEGAPHYDEVVAFLKEREAL